VPPYAIGPALITVGALMMLNVVRIKWEQTAEALPAFLTIIIMPATFSIAYGAAPGERGRDQAVFGLGYFDPRLPAARAVPCRRGAAHCAAACRGRGCAARLAPLCGPRRLLRRRGGAAAGAGAAARRRRAVLALSLQPPALAARARRHHRRPGRLHRD